MHFYHVWVANQSFHGTEPLTYSCHDALSMGQIVQVELRSKRVAGLVVAVGSKPSFATKEIVHVYKGLILPTASLELLRWLLTYYPAPAGLTISQFIPSGLLLKQLNEAPILEQTLPPSIKLPTLTTEQVAAMKQLLKPAGITTLLHGATGSGKTRLYLERTIQVIKRGQSVLVLTPEISLTSPLVKIFADAVHTSVIVIHSGLSEKQKREAWLRVLQAHEPVVVIGPRSALFSPFQSLGLIVIDEAHDSAYKQDQAPYYQAQRVAAKLAELHKAQLIIGTATPSVADYYIASAKHLDIIRLKDRALGDTHARAAVTIVDIRERENFTKDSYLSGQLLSAIEGALHRGEQSLLFLNRRGTARVVLCQSCGWQALCSNCDLPLTYHDDRHELRCHTCGSAWPAITSCPECHSADVLYRSMGTKALANAVQRHFPEAIVKRFDGDNLKRDSFEQNYQEVADGTVDIIVGTQLLIKGHDLPNLSVVGVVSADSSLAFPDFTAEEQTYQLISQVIGRVGRGHRAGTAIIQTFQPSNRALIAAVHDDWAAFYQAQLDERRTFQFPPFVQLLKVQCARASRASAQKAAHNLKQALRDLRLPVQILGPSPCFIEKAKNKYRWQLVIKARSRSPLLEIIRQLPPNWTHDIDPVNLL